MTPGQRARPVAAAPFWSAVALTYSASWRFIFALPVLAAAIIAFEGGQHVVEWLDGMYAGRAGLVAAAHDPHRLSAGSFKVVWLLIVEYWVTRYVVSGSAAATLARDPVAVRKFAVVLVIGSAVSLALLWTPELFAMGGRARALASDVSELLQIATLPVGIAVMTPWIKSAALGDARAGPLFALRRAWGSIWWGVGLTLVVILPPMVLHYVLGLGAVGKPAPLAVAMLIGDAAVVGYLGVLIGASGVPIAERMAARVGEVLTLRPGATSAFVPRAS